MSANSVLESKILQVMSAVTFIIRILEVEFVMKDLWQATTTTSTTPKPEYGQRFETFFNMFVLNRTETVSDKQSLEACKFVISGFIFHCQICVSACN